MAKKQQQSSGPSYSLLALLKRTLFLHETSGLDELVEEVHEYMLKDQSYEQIKERYVSPILHSNPSFLEVIDVANHIWRLAEGNKVNDSVYEVFQKYRTPLSERQILNRLAKVEHMAGNINISLDLKNDARFSDLEGGKYWILSEWVVVNEYARSILLKIKPGLPEKELLNRVVGEYHVEKDSAIFIPKLDERFVKKETRWTLRRFMEQKTKLRASRIERLYQYLLKAERPMSADELTATVLNMPANMTDVHEKLSADPRFVLENDNWDLRTRIEQQQALLAEIELAAEQEQPVVEEALEAVTEIVPEPTLIEASVEQDIQSEVPIDEAESAGAEVSEALIQEDQEDLQVSEQDEMAPETEEELPEVEQPLPEEEDTFVEEEDFAGEEEAFEEEEEFDQMDEYIENLRNKVIDFLQDAFHSEGVVYNAEIIDQFVNSEDREDIFRQFIQDHYVNSSKGRMLTVQDILKFMVYLAEPTLNDKILDPCCGSGGFLEQILETLDDYLQDAEWTERDFAIQYELRTGQFYFVQMNEEEREYFDTPLDDEVARWLPVIRFCKQQQLTGVDIDRFAYRTADLNMAIQGFPEIVLHHGNALTSKQIGSGVYDIVIGNPPTSTDNPTRFLRKSLTLAKPGGKILLLLPDTMFKDHRLISTTLRNQIITQTTVKAVIRFPASADSEVYGPQHTLLYCLRKHRDTEQESDIFIGDVVDFDGLRDVLDVIEEPDVPVSLSDEPIDGRIVHYILSSYQRSAYTLLLEGLRSQAIYGEAVSVKDWSHLKKARDPEEEDE